MNNRLRLQQAHEDHNFYLSVGDHALAEFARQRWVYLNSIYSGEQHVA